MTSATRPDTAAKPAKRAKREGPVSKFAHEYLTHFNAGTLVRAADAYRELIDDGGQMLVSVAGAASTGEVGKCLAELIRQEKVHALSVTGANLEEDLFNLIGQHTYEQIPHYRDLTPEDEQEIRAHGKSRVTDVAIKDDAVFKPVIEALTPLWKAASRDGDAKFPHEYLYQLVREGTLETQYHADPENSWLVAAAKRDLPIVVPGWEDSTLGNAFASAVLRGDVDDVLCVRSGIEYMIALCGWYAATAPTTRIGMLQLGGGIAGDFPICVVPVLRQELDRAEMPLWAYFCQITDATESYGGYSGAAPSEKITWEKLGADTPWFDIHSDFTIVFPLIAAIVLGD